MADDGVRAGGPNAAPGPDRNEVFARPRASIQRKLFLSHLRVAAIGLGILVLGLGIMQLLRWNALRLAQGRGPVVNASLQVLGGVQRSVAELSGWVAFGDPVFRDRRVAAWQHEITPALAELRNAGWLWDGVGANRLAELERMLGDFEKLQAEIEKLAHALDGEAPEAVQKALAGDLVPQGRRVAGFLRGISAGQMALMEMDAVSVSLITRIGVVVSMLLIVAMAVLAWTASARGAQRITEPIRSLLAATEEVAAGRLGTEITVTAEDEIGQLTTAFNSMRASLARTLASIGDTSRRLADATSQILAATTQQAKATREQTVATRETLHNVDEVTARSVPVARRAREIASSMEAATATIERGRRALESWLTEMGSLRARLELTPLESDRQCIQRPLGALNEQMGRIHEAMDTLARMLVDAEQVAVEAGEAAQEHAGRLAEVRRAMDRVNRLGEQTMERTIQVEQVAQDLKAHSRALKELLEIYPQFDRSAVKS